MFRSCLYVKEEHNMILHDKIAEQLPEWRSRYKALGKEHAEVVVDKVTVGQVVGGMRDIKSLVTDISYVDPAEASVSVVNPFPKC